MNRVVRREIISALKRISGTDQGDEPANWISWFETSYGKDHPSKASETNGPGEDVD